MANLIKIGHTFLNVDRVIAVEDRFTSGKENALVVRYGAGDHETITLSGREADDLRTWLNGAAVNLHDPGSDLDMRG
jgi:hypothetical protein